MKVPIPARPRKKYGQNFLRDENVLDKIIHYFAPSATDVVLEIGAGTGALTSRVAPEVKKLIAVEIDPDLIPYLEKIPAIAVLNQDVLRVDVCSLISESERIRVLGNLPYYISTPVLTALIRQRACISDMVLMFQAEVADRILAKPGDKDYSYLSVLVQYFCELDKGFKVSRNSFAPRPEVNSRVLRFNLRRQTRFDYETFSAFIEKAFAQRRKKLRNNLIRSLAVSAEQLDGALKTLGVSPDARAENLSAQQFEQLMYLCGWAS